MEQKEFFEITSVSREDLESRGFDTSNVTDEMMQELASKMADDYCEQLFWDSMTIIAKECLNIPMKDINPNEERERYLLQMEIDEVTADNIGF